MNNLGNNILSEASTFIRIVRDLLLHDMMTINWDYT